MKQISKKAVSLLLVLVMVIALLPTIAFAAEGMTVTIGSKTVDNVAGTTVTVPVTLKNNPGITAANIEVKFDNAVLELVKVVDKGIFAKLTFTGSDDEDVMAEQLATANKNGAYSLGWFGMSASKENGVIAELTFKVIAGAKAGDKALTEGKVDVVGSDGKTPVETTVVAGSVTLKDKVVKVASVKVSPTTMNLEVGQTGTLTATVAPVNATNQNLTWSSSNEKAATVDANGVVTAVGQGSATITAKADNGKSGTCKVTVKVPAHKHTPVAVPAQESTCKEKGWEAYYKCSECGTVVDENGNAAQIVYLPLAAHKLTETKAVPATCTEDGTEAYWTCSVCEKMFADKDGKKEIKAPAKIAALGHDIGEKTLETAGVAGSKMALYSATCKNCDKTVYTAELAMPDNTLNVVVKQSENSKKDFSKAVSFTLSTSKFLGAPVFTIDPVTEDIVTAAKTEAGYKVAGKIDKADYAGAIAYELPDYYDTAEEAYAAMAAFMKDGLTFTQKISSKENTWKADAKSHTMTFDINTADGTFTVKVDGNDNVSAITFTNTFTYSNKTTSGNGSGSGSSDTTKNDGKKVESGKTFDAGIAMYVGLSVLSVTGGALVIGKKKERF